MEKWQEDILECMKSLKHEYREPYPICVSKEWLEAFNAAIKEEYEHSKRSNIKSKDNE